MRLDNYSGQQISVKCRWGKMNYIDITASARSHMLSVVKALAQAGWAIIKAPKAGRLSRNKQLLILQTESSESRFRVFVYKVTGSSRGKPDERRIEITSTYQKGLERISNYEDVVLGFDDEHRIFVGVDPIRIAYGGLTGNASSFFDREGLDWNRENEILIRPRSAKMIPGGLEYHAFFAPPCLAEYLLNFQLIHSGSYMGYGYYSGRIIKVREVLAPLRVLQSSATDEVLILKGPLSAKSQREVMDDLVKAFEEGETKKLRQAKLSPEKLLEIKRHCEENGYIGEEIVLNRERRELRRIGKGDLAAKVRWVSQESAGEGYDILSFEPNGVEKWIEVKSSSGSGRVFEMSDNEWKTAAASGDKYYIYRVTRVRTKPKIKIYRNPHELEKRGLIRKSPSGWRITLE